MTLFIIIFFSSFVLTYLVKLFAQKKMLMDIPNERSSHVTPTPRGGGLAIAMVWFSVISYLNYSELIASNLYYALLSGVLISIISFIDDIYTIKSLPRIIVQSISTLIALYFIGGLSFIDVGFFTIENPIFLNILAFVAVIWFVNLFNFIDGIDGHLSTGSIFIALALFIFSGDSLLVLLALTVFGFLPWNWSKAKIFMGDIGSTLLGFTFAILMLYYNNTEQIPILTSLILSSVFWFDATFTIIKRYLNHEKIGQAHKKHAYQRIVQFGFSHQKTVLWVMAINSLLLIIASLALVYHQFVVLFLLLIILLLWTIYKYIDTKKPFN